MYRVQQKIKRDKKNVAISGGILMTRLFLKLSIWLVHSGSEFIFGHPEKQIYKKKKKLKKIV